MRSYLFDPAPLPSKQTSTASIEEADDYDFSHLDGVAKDEDDPLNPGAPTPKPYHNANPLVKTGYLLRDKIKLGLNSAWFRIRNSTRKEQVIAISSTVVIAIVLGFTLGYLTPDDEVTPGVSQYYNHEDTEAQVGISSIPSDTDPETVEFLQQLNSSDGSEAYAQYPDAPVTDQPVGVTGFFGSLLGFGKSSYHSTTSYYLFEQLQELALVDNTAYCIPYPGITSPFNCTRACSFFSSRFELVTSFTETAFKESTTGFIAVDHSLESPRILVVFRGTNSRSDWLVDLDTYQDPYVANASLYEVPECESCRVHRGFLRSFYATQKYVDPVLANLTASYPDYEVVITGHSLGGAIAILFGVDAVLKGYHPKVVTYGQPRVGNSEFASWVDDRFFDWPEKLLRVTHRNDPVVRVPFGPAWRHHSGEIYVSKGPLAPTPEDCYICDGQEDLDCSAGEGIISLTQLRRAHAEYFTTIGICRFQI
ncbi:Alpha/Beta hydrolase protein [Lipomyces japonicus]|uniref:Alpha/Beta hydrolase protein n=1 Tax=Lipomyces japonicus TaxID=56871 RepID=UPI0034CFF5DB